MRSLFKLLCLLVLFVSPALLVGCGGGPGATIESTSPEQEAAEEAEVLEGDEDENADESDSEE